MTRESVGRAISLGTKHLSEQLREELLRRGRYRCSIVAILHLGDSTEEAVIEVHPKESNSAPHPAGGSERKASLTTLRATEVASSPSMFLL
jgi:hypothetical protein